MLTERKIKLKNKTTNTMIKPIKNVELKRLSKFIDQNSDFDFLSANLLNSKTIDSLNWKGLSKHKDQLIVLLKMHQRLQRVLPKNDPVLIESLMKSGIHSAIQIASIPKSKFVLKYNSVFNNNSELIETTYQKAVAIRSQILIKHIAAIQKAEPYASKTKLNLN